MCLMKQLELITSRRQPMLGDRKKEKHFEVFMCFILPIVFMGLHYIVQGHRFDILETMGCRPTYYNSIPSLFIITIPPLLIGLANLIFGVLIIIHLIRYKITIRACLHESPSSISVSRFVRLLALSFIVMLVDNVENIYISVFNINQGLSPYTSWADVHYNFSRIARFPRFLISDADYATSVALWWIVPTSCIFFFACLATGEEAMKDYRTVHGWVVGRLCPNRKNRRAAEKPLAQNSEFSTSIVTENWKEQSSDDGTIHLDLRRFSKHDLSRKDLLETQSSPFGTDIYSQSIV